MAKGFKELHPIIRENLKNIGIKDEEVTQAWGTKVKASAGFHDPEGWVTDEFGKHRYSSCVDLTGRLPFSPELKSHLISAGFCPFFRDWTGNRHIHCVYVKFSTILEGPKSQIIDYIEGKNGLVGHAKLNGPLAPTKEERKIVKAAFDANDGHNTVKVMFNNKKINCYAFMGKIESGQEVTRCELRPFVEFFGSKVIDGEYLLHNGKLLSYAKCEAKLEGQFTRVGLRTICNLLGLKIESFEMKNGYGIVKMTGGE